MAAKILSCTKATDGYRFTVHLDETKVDDEIGQPLPEYVRQWTWGLPQPSQTPMHETGGHDETGQLLHACHTQHGKDVTEQQYLENIVAMLPEMVELELQQMGGRRLHDRRRELAHDFTGKEIH